MNRKSTISLILFWMTAFAAVLVLPQTGFAQTYNDLNSKIQICQDVRNGILSFRIGVGNFVYGPPPQYMRVLFPPSTTRGASMSISLASSDTGVGITLRYGQALTGSVEPQNRYGIPPDNPIMSFGQMEKANLGISIDAGGSVSHSIFYVGSQQGELVDGAGEWLYVHTNYGRDRIGTISYVFSVDEQATLDWCGDQPGAITFKPITADSRTFADLLTVASDVTWVRLWTSESRTPPYNGSWVDTSKYNSYGLGWIAVGDLSKLKIDYAQANDRWIWAQTWNATRGEDAGKWDEMNFAIATTGFRRTQIDADTPIADMFNRENEGSNSWYQIWVGTTGTGGTEGYNGAGFTNGYLDTNQGSGWVKADTAEMTTRVFPLAAAGQELWVRGYQAGHYYGWESWTVTAGSSQNVYNLTPEIETATANVFNSFRQTNMPGNVTRTPRSGENLTGFAANPTTTDIPQYKYVSMTAGTVEPPDDCYADCVLVDEDTLALTVPCVDVSGYRYGLRFNYINGYIWELDGYSIFETEAQKCQYVDEDLNLNVTCADYAGEKYGFMMMYDEDLFWRLDENTFHIMEPRVCARTFD